MDPRLISALDREDVSAAVAFITDEDDPLRVLAMFHGAVRHAYWSRRDMDMVVVLGRFAIEFAGDDVYRIGPLKAISYDLASFCWPGWGEEGIVLDEHTFAFGREAAALNLSLAYQLDRPPAGKAAAHWLIGAYMLADDQREHAATSFDTSVTLANESGDEVIQLLMANYARIARREPLELAAFDGIPEGEMFVAQLETALLIYP